MAESAAAAAAAAGRKTRVGPYDLGKTIGEGSFAKVKLARDARTGAVCAIKVLDRNHVLRHKMVEQINREISTMKVIKHPNVVQLHEVMASKTNIYMVLEFFDGGELFDKIVNSGRLNEDEARRYFHQFINAVDYCHSRGVYHRDLKPWKLRLARQGSDTEGTSGVQRAGTEGELLRAGAEDDLRREGTEGEHRASDSADVVGKLRRHCKDVRRRLPSFA